MIDDRPSVIPYLRSKAAKASDVTLDEAVADEEHSLERYREVRIIYRGQQLPHGRRQTRHGHLLLRHPLSQTTCAWHQIIKLQSSSGGKIPGVVMSSCVGIWMEAPKKSGVKMSRCKGSCAMPLHLQQVSYSGEENATIKRRKEKKNAHMEKRSSSPMPKRSCIHG